MCLAFIGVPPGRADEWNQKTILTFSGPVEVPGQVLPAGTYVFKLLDSPSDRNIVQVFDKNEQHLYGTFLAIADYHLRPRGKTIITFEERAAGAPEAVKAWFYPGENYGHEFVYPKARATQLAQVNHTAVPSMPNEMKTTENDQQNNSANVTAMQQAPLKAQEPNQAEVEIEQEFSAQNQTAENNNPAPPANQQAYNNPPQTAPANTPASLPRTANDWPTLSLAGLLFLASGGLLRRSAAKAR
jgi:LPXTG-motif cell wall-anchored protein